MKIAISISLSEELIKKIDKKRGLIARSVLIEDLLQRILEEEDECF